MSLKFSIPAVTALSIAFSPAVDAADLPDYEMIQAMTMTADQHIMHVSEQCLPAWDGEECAKAVAWSNRSMASDYFDALIDANTEETNHGAAILMNNCPVINPYDWVNFPNETWDACTDIIHDVRETGVVPNKAQYDIFFLAPLAQDGMPTAQGILSKTLSEYASEKGWTQSSKPNKADLTRDTTTPKQHLNFVKN